MVAPSRVGTPTIDASSSNRSSYSFSHTVPSGATLLIVTLIIEGDESFNAAPAFNGDGMTLIRQTTNTGSNGDVRIQIFGLVNPDVGTFTLAGTYLSNVNPDIVICRNWTDTDTTDVPTATNFISEDVNTSASSTTVLTSGGTSGNTLYAVGGFQGADGDAPVGWSSAAFTEILEDSVGSASTGMSYADAEHTTLAAGTTITWNATDENTGVLIELVAAAGNDQTLTATATGVAAIQLSVAKTLAATAIATPIVATTLTAFVTAAATAIGVATIATLRTAFVTAAATAIGVVNLARKIKIGLGSTATGTAALGRKIFKTLASTATAIALVAVNEITAVTNLTLEAVATVIAALQLKTLKTLATTATGITGLQRKAKLALGAIATGIPTLAVVSLAVLVALNATATAIVAVQLKTKKGLAVTATIVATIAESVLSAGSQTLTAIATGIVAAGRKIKISLR